MSTYTGAVPLKDHSPNLFAHLSTIFVSSHVEEGLAKIFNFHVLRHGTALPYYLDIIENGADPSYGGKTTENFISNTNFSKIDVNSEQLNNMAANCKGRFFVFKDVLAFKSIEKIYAICSDIFLTRFHAVLSAKTYNKEYAPKNKALKSLHKIAHVTMALFTPRIRFMYREQEVDALFQEDPDYKPLALYTEQKLPSDRIGLIGIVKHAKIDDLKGTPLLRMVYGVAQVALGVGLTVCGLGAIT